MDCLEIKKIEEFLEKESERNRTSKYGRLVILSDSKGRYLRTEEDKVKTCNLEIVWWSIGGRNTKGGVKYLTDNIHTLRDGVHTLILFWHFTCDITKKENNLIYPRYRDSTDLTDNIQPYLDVLKQIHSTEEKIDIGILEAPPVVTREWNKLKEAVDWEIVDDSDLHTQISTLNEIIRTYNGELNYQSPRFECDFQHRRRNRKKGSGVTKTKETLNPILLKDGVHPVGIVARKWLLKIICSLSTVTNDNTM